MNEKDKTNRRGFLKKALGLGILGGTFAGPTSFLMELKTSEQSDPIPKAHIYNKVISGKEFLFYGVQHTYKFAVQNYETIENMVSKSSAVIVEGPSEEIRKYTETQYGNPYFSVVSNFAHRHKKKLIGLDSQSNSPITIETILTGLGLILGLHAGIEIPSTETRRELITKIFKGTLGAYFVNSHMYTGLTLKSKIYEKIFKDPDEADKQMFKDEVAYFNHIIDQRNIEFTERIKRIPKLIEDEIEDGPLMVTLGKAHTIGIEYYLQNPRILKAKKAMYSFNYGLLDSDEISIYTPEKNGGWSKRIIEH